MEKKVTLIVPTIARDFPVLLRNVDLYFEYIPINKVCVIGDSKVRELIPNDTRFCFLDEAEVLDIEAIKSAYFKRCTKTIDQKRFGWYLQQFIKMAYCNKTEDEYYLLWDSDTIPVKCIDIFNECGYPYQDTKTEFFQGYFDTIGKLIPGMSKEYHRSFIAEHMLIKTELMRSLINEISKNYSIKGDSVFKKIINAIKEEDLPKSGFSEFETYGTYVYSRYPDTYILREWKSMRYGAFFFESNKKLNQDDLSWLSMNYHAISVETNNKLAVPFSKLVNTYYYKSLFPSTTLDNLSIIIRGYRRFIRLFQNK